jgi:hypothetical protein
MTTPTFEHIDFILSFLPKPAPRTAAQQKLLYDYVRQRDKIISSAFLGGRHEGESGKQHYLSVLRLKFVAKGLVL